MRRFLDTLGPVSTAQTAGTGLRERKKLATREALARAAVRLAVERGLVNVRVEDITAEVNVSRRTFTNYFSSKEEAIASVNTERTIRAAEALRQRPADEPLADALADVLAKQYQAATSTDRDDVERIRLLASSPALRGEYLKTLVAAERPLAEAIAERTGADAHQDLFPQVLAAAVSGAVRVATGRWMATGGAESLPLLIRQAVTQIADGRPPTSTLTTRLDPIGLISAAGFAVAVLVSVLAGGSTVALELREPAVTGIIGLACAVSVAVRRPLHLVVLRSMGRRNPQAAQIASDPASLRKSAVITVLAGAICLAHAAVVTALALTLPVGTFLAVSHPVGLSIFGAGLATLLWYRRKHTAGSDTPAGPVIKTSRRSDDPASRPDRP